MAAKWAFSTNAFTRVTVFDAARAIAACGYDGVEIMADVPHAYPPEFGAAERERLRRVLDGRGLALSNVNAFMLYGIRDCYEPSFTSNDPADRAARLAHTKAAMRLARDLGAPSVSIEPGGPVPGRPVQGPAVARPPDPLPPAEGWRAFLDALRELAVLGERLHVDVLVEPEPGLLVESPSEFLALMEDLAGSYPAIGLNFDLGHVFCVGEDPAAWASRLAPWTRHVHVADIPATRFHRHLLPGDGAIDLARAVAAIEATGYDGFFTVELYPYQDDPAGTARLALERLAGRTAAEAVMVPA